MARTVQIQVRFTPQEARRIRAIVKANTGTTSEFIRVCVNRALMEAGDPEAARLLEAMFKKGIDAFVQRRVAAEIAKAKSEHGEE